MQKLLWCTGNNILALFGLIFCGSEEPLNKVFLHLQGQDFFFFFFQKALLDIKNIDHNIANLTPLT